MINDKIKVAIIGRTNVGKSTLFNRLTETKRALVSNIPGTTRDRNYGECSWANKTFTLVDTGGLEKIPTKIIKKPLAQASEEIERKIIEQTLKEINEADLILFLIDAKDGVMPQEKEFANFIRKGQKKTLLVINKVDNNRIRRELDPEIYKLGLAKPNLVSATNGVGTGDLLDEITKNLPPQKNQLSSINNQPSSIFKIAIIGKPNVGKSSLLNALFGEERVIVSEIPHTTREAHDTLINYKDNPLLLVDTAGIRRKSKLTIP